MYKIVYVIMHFVITIVSYLALVRLLFVELKLLPNQKKIHTIQVSCASISKYWTYYRKWVFLLNSPFFLISILFAISRCKKRGRLTIWGALDTLPCFFATTLYVIPVIWFYLILVCKETYISRLKVWQHSI